MSDASVLHIVMFGGDESAHEFGQPHRVENDNLQKIKNKTKNYLNIALKI